MATGVFGPGIDQPISLFRSGENYYYHSDALGSIYQMTDSSENIVKSYDYSAFGQIISESGSLPFENVFTYTGREYDSDSGLYYYRARYYDAEIGRFLSRDQIGLAGGINLYVYAGNNPIVLLDPNGLAISFWGYAGMVTMAVGATMILVFSLPFAGGIVFGIGAALFISDLLWIEEQTSKTPDKVRPNLPGTSPSDQPSDFYKQPGKYLPPDMKGGEENGRDIWDDAYGNSCEDG